MATTATRSKLSVPRGWLASWTLYDIGNTVWSYGVLSIAIGLWLAKDSVLGQAQGGLWLQLSIALSVGINALVSPWIGSLSDRSGRRMPYLLFFTIFAIVPVLLIPSVPVPIAIALFCIANFSYQSSLIYYDTTIKLVSTPANRGWVSGLANGLGYVGTILMGLISLVGGLSVEQVFIVAPSIFALMAIPMFLIIKEQPAPVASSAASGSSLGATVKTIRSLKKYPGLGRFLLARFFYTDAQNTVIKVMGVFAVYAVGLETPAVSGVFVALATTAVFGGLFWGRLTDLQGPKATLRIVLGLWAIALLIASIWISPIPFVIAGVVLGFGFGGLAGADRILMFRLSPPERLGEFYGLYGLVGKGSSVIGGVIYGLEVFLLQPIIGSAAYSVGLLTLLASMLVGMYLLEGVPEQRQG
jgi:MFS transporter, UMF1 family